MADSLIHRWSKQKTQARVDEEKPVEDAQLEQPEVLPGGDSDDSTTQDNQEKDEEKPLELPPIESLDDDSDYSMFMSPEVDEGLKKIALRKLFKAPFFNVVDGLNDYDEDFTTFEALGDIVTSDMKFHEERKKAEQALEQQQSVESEDVESMDDVETLSTDTATEEDESQMSDSNRQVQQAPELAQSAAQSDPDDSETPTA